MSFKFRSRQFNQGAGGTPRQIANNGFKLCLSMEHEPETGAQSLSMVVSNSILTAMMACRPMSPLRESSLDECSLVRWAS
jgi:hypothetical protein